MKIRSTVLALGIAATLTGCQNMDSNGLLSSGAEAFQAYSLSDAQVKTLSDQACKEMDAKAKIAPASSEYSQRLSKIATALGDNINGQPVNYKVYETKDVNAFAMANGCIRVYSGLMDLMNDQELLFVIGHEMGHVVHDHTRRKVMMAYATSAVKKGLASQDNQVGLIAGSMIGAFAEQLVNAQFSQHEERQADRYGAAFLKAAGHDIGPAVSALEKLADLARQHTFLSSHPNPDTRAKKLLTGDDAADDDESWIDKTFSLIKHLVVGLFNIVIAMVNWLLSLL